MHFRALVALQLEEDGKEKCEILFFVKTLKIFVMVDFADGGNYFFLFFFLLVI